MYVKIMEIKKFIFISLLFLNFIYGDIWIEKTHQDFIDGFECHQFQNNLISWKLGGRIYSPASGGLRIIGQDRDINDDGWPEMVLTSFPEGKVYIYWGSAEGFNLNNYYLITNLQAGPQAVSLIDIDENGYLDALIGSYNGSGLASIHLSDNNGNISPIPSDILSYLSDLVNQVTAGDINYDGYLDIFVTTGFQINIYYGPGPFGGRYPDKILQGSFMMQKIELVDLNYDTYLDIATISDAQSTTPKFIIFWGPDFTNSFVYSFPGGWDFSIADLNNDGYLDVVISSIGSNADAILWGPNFSQIQYLVGSGNGNMSINEVNGDEYLDIVMNQRNLNSVLIYWGPTYTNYFSLPGYSGLHTLMIADWNRDSYMDLLTGSISNYARLYWNSPQGFDSLNFFEFPNSSNDVIYEDLGNLWNRLPYERYLSSIYNTNNLAQLDSVKYYGNFPNGVNVEMRSSLDSLNWSSWYIIQPGQPYPPEGRYFQYRLTFYLDYLQTTKIKLDSIKFFFSSSLLNIFPDTSSYVHPKDSVIYKVKAVYTGETNELVYLFTSNTHPGWFVKLTDTLGNLIDTILLIPNDTFDFNLKIYSPEYPSPFECDTTYIKGYLISNPLKRDSARIITKITGNISLKIEPDTEGVTVPGVTIPYPLRVINTGEFKDSILLSYTNSSSGYISYITDSTGSQIINFVKTFPKDTVKIILWVTPLPATPDSQNLTKVIARSSWINSIYDSALVMTYLYHMPYLLVEPDTFSYGNPGDNLKYRLRVINNQESIDTINLSFHHNQNWNARITDTLGNLINKIYVPAKDTGFIIFEISIPENSSGGIRDTAFIKGVSNNLSISDSARIITEVKVSAAVYIEPDQQKEGAPGEKIRYYLKVINSGNSQDIINVYVLQSNWAERIIYDSLTNMPLNDNNNDGYQDVILAPLAFQKIYVNVDIPQNASSEDNDVAIIRASSTNNPSVWDNANLFTQVKKVFYSIILEPDTEISIPYNSSFLINLYSLFQGNSNDYIELEYSFSGANLNIELRDSQGLNPLIDNNHNGNIDLGVCEPSNKNYFSIYLRAPEFNYSISDTEDICIIRLKGYLYSYNTLYDSAKIKINLIPPLYIFNYESPFDSKRGTNFFISVPEDGKGNLEVYSRLGEKIITLFKNKPLKRGKHIIYWNGKNEKGNYVAPGVYIYVFEFKGEKIKKTITKKTSVKR
ncbi:MAG: FG-GAP-like repeat-containing protein [candidate division WOR-3 bacterium]